jgi:hypothetical protein
MKRAFPAVLAGAATLFVWQTISWVVLPWHSLQYQPFSDEKAVLEAVAAHAPRSGAYASPGFKPGMTKLEQEAVLMAKLEGPFVMAWVMKDGVRPIGKAMALSFLGNLLAAFLAVWLVGQLGPRSLVERTGALLTAAWLAWAWARVPDFVWWGYPCRLLLTDLADYTVSWLLTGLVIGLIVHPKTAE